MHFTTILPLLSALSGLAAAQAFNITAVPIATRDQWCVNQKTSCPLLCLQYPGNDASTTSNDCDPDTLAYSCVCLNGQSPNASEYSQTVPYFECTEANNQCVAACVNGDAACASACRDNNPCGAQNPTRINATSSSSSGTASATATGSDAEETDGSDGSGGDDNGSGDDGSSAETTYATLGGGSSPTAAAGAGTDASGQSAGISLFDFGRSYGLAVVLGSVFAGFALVL